MVRTYTRWIFLNITGSIDTEDLPLDFENST